MYRSSSLSQTLQHHVLFCAGLDTTAQYPAAIAEDSESGAYVLTVFAIDRDGTEANNKVRK